MERATVAIAAGDFTRRVIAASTDELGRLAVAFNRMAETLQTTTTSRDELEAEVRERNRALEEARDERPKAVDANRAKSEFLARMSHEIRTPMNGVLGMTELTLETDLDAMQRENLTTVRDSGLHLLAVINDILDYSKIDAGKLVLELELRLAQIPSAWYFLSIGVPIEHVPSYAGMWVTVSTTADIKPTIHDALELGLRKSFERTTVDANLYYTQVHDRVVGGAVWFDSPVESRSRPGEMIVPVLYGNLRRGELWAAKPSSVLAPGGHSAWRLSTPGSARLFEMKTAFRRAPRAPRLRPSTP